MRIQPLIFITIVVWYFPFFDVFAYIDPGTGSYFFQIIIAGIVAASFGIRMFWNKIKAWFYSIFSKNRNNTAIRK